MQLESKIVNAMMDSGAGCSVIDIGTLENIGLVENITSCDDHLVNASGDEMDIAGL